MIDPHVMCAFNDEMRKQAKVPGFAFHGMMRAAGTVGRSVGAPQAAAAAKDSFAFGKNVAHAAPAGGLWSRLKGITAGTGAAVQNFNAAAGHTPLMQFAGQALT
jgi:hypothetical protein